MKKKVNQEITDKNVKGGKLFKACQRILFVMTFILIHYIGFFYNEMFKISFSEDILMIAGIVLNILIFFWFI